MYRLIKPEELTINHMVGYMGSYCQIQLYPSCLLSTVLTVCETKQASLWS